MKNKTPKWKKQVQRKVQRQLNDSFYQVFELMTFGYRSNTRYIPYPEYTHWDW